jgi:hypothetical protein
MCRELCRSVVPFLSSFSMFTHSLYCPQACWRLPSFPAYLMTPVSFVSASTSNLPAEVLSRPAFVSSLVVQYLASLFAKREPILGVRRLAIIGARQGQAMGLLPLHDSCFALAYPYPTFHTLPLSLLKAVYTMAPVSRDHRLPFSRMGIIGRSDGK